MTGYLQSSTGEQKKVKLGFSWTTFFFGFFVAIFRKDIKWAAILIAIAIVAIFLFDHFFLTLNTNLIFAFFYNKIYIKDLIDKGYEPVGKKFAEALLLKGILFTNFIPNSTNTSSQPDDMSIF